MLRALLVAIGCALLVAGVGWLVGGPTVLGLPAAVVLALGALLVQWLAFVPAWLARTERFYDLTGSLTFLGLVGAALALGGPHGPRGWILAGLVALWALRLGAFLALRIHRAGGDARFDSIKGRAGRFLVAWTLQGVWVFVTVLPVVIVLLATPGPGLGWADAVGLGLWALGFLIEVVADRQKSAARAEHPDRWIDTGLWRWSRHPNYFGEILLWVGIAISAATTFEGARWIGLLSPVFVALLITRVSGIPPTESRADDKWGGEPGYEAYKERTPVLIPRPPSR